MLVPKIPSLVYTSSITTTTLLGVWVGTVRGNQTSLPLPVLIAWQMWRDSAEAQNAQSIHSELIKKETSLDKLDLISWVPHKGPRSFHLRSWSHRDYVMASVSEFSTRITFSFGNAFFLGVMSLSSWALKTIKMKEGFLLLEAASRLQWESPREARGRETLSEGQAACQRKEQGPQPCNCRPWIMSTPRKACKGSKTQKRATALQPARPCREEPVRPCPRAWPAENWGCKRVCLAATKSGPLLHSCCLLSHDPDALPSQGLQHAGRPPSSLSPRVCQIHVHWVSDATILMEYNRLTEVSCSLSLPNTGFKNV